MVWILMDIDWSVLFKSLYAAVRMKIVVRDVSKVPPSRIVELEQKLYMLTFIVDGIVDNSEGGDDPSIPSVLVPNSTSAAMETDGSLNNPPVTNQPPSTIHVSGSTSAGQQVMEMPLVVDVSEIHLTDHMSWNGTDHADAYG
jgi:hypothetical protein